MLDASYFNLATGLKSATTGVPVPATKQSQILQAANTVPSVHSTPPPPPAPPVMACSTANGTSKITQANTTSTGGGAGIGAQIAPGVTISPYTGASIAVNQTQQANTTSTGGGAGIGAQIAPGVTISPYTGASIAVNQTQQANTTSSPPIILPLMPALPHALICCALTKSAGVAPAATSAAPSCASGAPAGGGGAAPSCAAPTPAVCTTATTPAAAVPNSGLWVVGVLAAMAGIYYWLGQGGEAQAA